MTTTNRLLAREKNSDGLRKLEAETVFLPPGPLSRIGLVLGPAGRDWTNPKMLVLSFTRATKQSHFIVGLMS